MAWIATNGNGKEFLFEKNLIEVDMVNMDIGILHILVLVVVFLYLMAASRSSLEGIYLLLMNQLNLKKNSYERNQIQS